MHELSVTQALLDTAVRHATAAGASRVTEIHVVLGDLASVVDDCVRFWWDEIARGTLCEGARLRFERIPARFRCDDCGAEFGIADGMSPCPGCGGVRLRVVAGDECRLESLAVEMPESPVPGPAPDSPAPSPGPGPGPGSGSAPTSPDCPAAAPAHPQPPAPAAAPAGGGAADDPVAAHPAAAPAASASASAVASPASASAARPDREESTP